MAAVSNRYLFVYATLGSMYPVWANEPDNLPTRSNLSHQINEYVSLMIECNLSERRLAFSEALDAYQRSPFNQIKKVIPNP